MKILPHIATRLFNTPLLIHRAKLDTILTVLGNRVGWPEQYLQTAPDNPAVSAEPPILSEGGLAVIPIHGTLVRRALAIEAVSGLTSYQMIQRQLLEAMADPGVLGIVLDIDSPGGEAGGIFELAEQIRSASRSKPIWAVVNDQAFSAAYALAAAADEIVITSTGGVGSIGVIAMHADQSRKDEQDGYRFTAVYAGRHKNDLSPHAPLSEEAHSTLQTEVNRLYGLFTESVATHRDLTIDEVRATEARVYFGDDAVDIGLADRVGTLSDALMAMRTTLSITPSITRTQETLTMEKTHTDPVAAKQPATPTVEASTNLVSDTQQDSELTLSAALQAARTEERAEIQAIAELCTIAGRPQLASDFIARGLQQAEARKALLELRASGPEIASHLSPDTECGTSNADPDQNPLMRIVRQQIGG
ncbi:MAG: S49 family peptidase [Cellvibrionaceae bacterium]|nr:S49 family peptidase [Cellvibrionaceae bacterium]